MEVFYQTCSESCPDITYSVFLNTSISEWLLPMTDYSRRIIDIQYIFGYQTNGRVFTCIFIAQVFFPTSQRKIHSQRASPRSMPKRNGCPDSNHSNKKLKTGILTFQLAYSCNQKSLYHEKPVGALVADFVLVLYHLADGIVVFFNGFFHKLFILLKLEEEIRILL